MKIKTKASTSIVTLSITASRIANCGVTKAKTRCTPKLVIQVQVEIAWLAVVTLQAFHVIFAATCSIFVTIGFIS